LNRLDQVKLTKLLKETTQDRLILPAKEFQQVQELVGILEPFAEATDLKQGDKTMTVSCVLPSVLSLRKKNSYFLVYFGNMIVSCSKKSKLLMHVLSYLPYR